MFEERSTVHSGAKSHDESHDVEILCSKRVARLQLILIEFVDDVNNTIL